jgi:hypothetical protein
MIFPLLLIASRLWSNGCVFDELGDARIGALRPVNASKVKLVAETLSVVVTGDSADVVAKYHLRNDGDSVKGVYGAPVDFFPSEMDVWPTQDTTGWDSRIFHKASISLDGGQNLPMESKGKPILLKGQPEYGIKRKWFKRSIALGPGEHVLELRVVVTASHSDGYVKGNDLIENFSKRVLAWDLAPAGNWGDGKAGRFVVKVDATELEKDSIPFAFSGLPLRREDSSWVFRSDNFDLAHAKSLKFEWNPDTVLRYRSLDRLAWKNPPWRGSANLVSYPLAALSDRDAATAWVAPAGRKEAWLEVDIPDSLEIGAVLLCPGFAKSRKLWTENDRVGKYRIKFPNALIEAPNRKTAPAESRAEKTWRIDDPPKHPWDYQIQSSYCRCEKAYRGGTLRIDFDSTLAGTRSRDLAISEIILLKCSCPEH